MLNIKKNEDVYRILISIYFFVVLIIITLPWAPLEILTEIDVDTSYRMILKHNQDLGLIFGKDVVITWGPLSHLVIYDLNPNNVINSLVFCLIFTAVISWAFYSISSAFKITWKDCFIIFIVSIIFIVYDVLALIYIVSIPSVLYILYLDGQKYQFPKITRHVLVILIAAAALTKFNYFLIGLFIVAMGSIIGVLERSEKRADLLLFVIYVLAFWTIANQPLSNFTDFIEMSLEVARGYGVGLSLLWPKFPIIELILLGAFGIASLPYLVTTFRVVKRGNFSKVLIGLSFLTLYAFAFKLGFTRISPGHFEQAIIGLLILGICLLVYSHNSYGVDILAKEKLFRAFMVILPIGLLTIFADLQYQKSYIKAGYLFIPLKKLETLPHTVSLKFSNITEFSIDKLTKQYNNQMSEIKNKFMFPDLKGTVDIIGNSQALIIANEFNYKPRMSFQSVNTVTKKLSQINALTLKENKPEHIIYEYSTLDNRLPSLQENSTWEYIFKNYTPNQILHNHIIFDRSFQENLISKEYISVMDHLYSFEENISIPSCSDCLGVWVEIVLDTNILGKLVSLFYKIPPLDINLQMPNGNIKNYRYLSDLGSIGFLISPHIDSSMAVYEVFNGMRNKKFNQLESPVSFSISGGAFGFLFYKKFSLSFYTYR